MPAKERSNDAASVPSKAAQFERDRQPVDQRSGARSGSGLVFMRVTFMVLDVSEADREGSSPRQVPVRRAFDATATSYSRRTGA